MKTCNRSKSILISALSYSAFIFCMLIGVMSCGQGNEPILNNEDSSIDKGAIDSLSILAVGDMMLGSDYPDAKKLPSQNILSMLKDTLKKATLTIGNLEGVIAKSNTITSKCGGKTNCYAFRMPVKFAAYFKEAGFDFLSLANNHSGDFGEKGTHQTMEILDAQGIAYAGIRGTCEVATIEKMGVRFGIIGVGHSDRLISINHPNVYEPLIREAKKAHDVVVVFFHGGAEGATALRVPKRKEIFFGEDRGNVYDFAHKCIDAGADIIIGSGPHVVRGMELYKGKLIAYSLGNFATFGSLSLKGNLGIAPILRINIDTKGNFLSGKIYATKQIKGDANTPMLDEDKSVINLIKELSKKDFAESALVIEADGTMQRR